MTEKICAVDLGMPTLLEASGAEESAALCAELGLHFVELNMNLPEYADPAIQQRNPLCRAAGTRGKGALPLFQRNSVQQADRRQ